MSNRVNQLGQPIGEDVVWAGAKTPPHSNMEGKYCRLEPIVIDRHAADLFEAFSADETGVNWTYMVVGPFETEADLREWMTKACLGDDPLFYAIIDKESSKAVGLGAYMRIAPAMGVIEVGSISYALSLQRTRAATEVMFLMMQHAFNELGYRRYEWKCDNLNAPSHKAAKRLGFTYEGLFRQALVYKGRNRDTAWFAIIDTEWPVLEKALTAWLDESNFDKSGNQVKKLEEFR